jgi:hypothetical protein
VLGSIIAATMTSQAPANVASAAVTPVPERRSATTPW